jgi:peptidyl-prolyl cis-trans isomerase SurA
VALVAVLWLAAAGAARAETVNRIILRVNDRIVTLYDYQERLAARKASIERSRVAPEVQAKALAESPADTLRDLMDEALLMSRGDQLSATVDEDRLDRAEQSAKRNFGIETDEQFQEALRQSGLTREQFRTQVRDQLLYQEVLGREVMQAIKVSEEELLRYYREHADEFSEPASIKLRELVVLERDGVTATERRAIAERLLGRLRAGETLQQIAAENQPTGVTSGAIELGWVTTTELDKVLVEGTSAVEVGKFSEPIAALQRDQGSTRRRREAAALPGRAAGLHGQARARGVHPRRTTRRGGQLPSRPAGGAGTAGVSVTAAGRARDAAGRLSRGFCSAANRAAARP